MMRRAGAGVPSPNRIILLRDADGDGIAETRTVFIDGLFADAFPDRYRGGAFIGQHGSWNHSVPNGYKVIFVAFENGRPLGLPEEILTGFLDEQDNALGRPVGVAVDRAGALLVADDVGNTVWRLTASNSQ
jgi:glucose/arabinose dehydrogenase